MYLLAGRKHWYSEAERDLRIAYARLESETFDLSKQSEFTWQVPTSELQAQRGEVEVSLRYLGDDPRHSHPQLTFQAVAESGSQVIDRQIYFDDLDPLTSKSISLTGHRTYSLGHAMVNRGDHLFVTVSNPNKGAGGLAIIEMVGVHDIALPGYSFFWRMRRDVGLFLSLLGLTAAAFMFLRANRSSKGMIPPA